LRQVLVRFLLMPRGEQGPEPARGSAFGSLPRRLGTGSDWIGFYRAHFCRVVRLVMYDGASLADAHEAAQEAFAESWALLSGDPARWEAVNDKAAWIRAVAVRKYRRPPGPRYRLPTQPGAVIPDLGDASLDPAELTVQTQAVLQALRGLEADERIVMAFYLDDFTTAAIAAALGVTGQRVRDIKKKARAALKISLADQRTREGRATV
jgi:RNA polymerase sigma factor (sigma-70 family)